MSNQLTIAWALPANPTHLVPRFEVYAESKAAVTILRLAARKCKSRPIGRLLVKLVVMIANYIQEDTYRRRVNVWKNAQKSHNKERFASDHFTKAEIGRLYFPINKDTVAEYLWNESDGFDTYKGTINTHARRLRIKDY